MKTKSRPIRPANMRGDDLLLHCHVHIFFFHSCIRYDRPSLKHKVSHTVLVFVVSFFAK